ncbi:hypothetical protein Cadr_000017800 [Camelus dromedarius]|uniref:Uncharacterized protein n=1 Tax=Camelus dromedarius TaxID=9838 RepID=A0A5N4D7A6_CAMDR|nr:hypothetical protein Cadr_000017800 [Camelus dromedarius]
MTLFKDYALGTQSLPTWAEEEGETMVAGKKGTGVAFGPTLRWSTDQAQRSGTLKAGAPEEALQCPTWGMDEGPEQGAKDEQAWDTPPKAHIQQWRPKP